MARLLARNVDLEKHLQENIGTAIATVYSDPLKRLILMMGIASLPDFPNLKYDYRELHFDGDINYHLEEGTSSTIKDTIDEVDDTNRSSTETTIFRLKRGEKVTNSYSWSSEQSVSVGISVSTTIKVPFVGGIDTTIETNYSFSSTETKTETKERYWEIVKEIPVPPRTKTTAIIMLEKTVPRVPFEMIGEFRGNILLDLGGDQPIRLPIAGFFSPEDPLPNVQVQGEKVYFRTSGVFTASEGIRIIIDGTETPLDPQPGQAPRKWTMNIRPDDQHLVIPQALKTRLAAADQNQLEAMRAKVLSAVNLPAEIKSQIQATNLHIPQEWKRQ